MPTALTQLFPVWAVTFSALAYAYPEPFVPLAPAVAPLLGVVMLGMGLTLTGESFKLVLRRPRVVLTGVALQYLLMPTGAYLIAAIFSLPAQLTAGLVLVGSCPGGTASNVITYLAGGVVALSITMTAISTFLSVVLTPLTTWLLVGKSVPVPVASMLTDILIIVIVPVSVGLIVNRYWGARLEPLKRVFPLVSVGAIVLIIAIIVAGNQQQISTVGWTVLLSVALHNFLGLGCGYGLARLSSFHPAECRTIAIEVGMQNSGLGVVLAQRYFTAVAALPGAIFSIWHNLSGSLLAAWWSTPNRRKSSPIPDLH